MQSLELWHPERRRSLYLRPSGHTDWTSQLYLLPKRPEFYATYKFLNVKNYTLYSDKRCLSVLDLTHINLATKENKQYQLDYWAAIFKSTTWEDLKMLAKGNEYIRQASETIYQLSQEEAIRQQWEARENYYRRQRGINDEFTSQEILS